MFKLKKEEFIKYCEEGLNFKIGNLTVGRNICFNFDNNKIEYTNYYIIENDISKEYKNIDEIIYVLNPLFENDYITIDYVNENFKTIEEYFEKLKFDSLTMNELIEKYKNCDEFSLTLPTNNYNLSKEEIDDISKKLEKDNYQITKNLYDKIEDKSKFPCFETLYNEIKQECEEFELKNKDEYLNRINFFSNSFICDHVGKDTKYNEPINIFWHFYHRLGMELDQKNELLEHKNYLENSNEILEKYPVLKNNHVRTEYTHTSHCTSGPLQIVVYFKLNNETKNWLKQFKTDYTIEYFEDLAFYKNGVLKFSSCTHEGFHFDYTDNQT